MVYEGHLDVEALPHVGEGVRSMHAKIIEISHLTDTPMTYVLIHIWGSKADYTKNLEEPTGDNQFIMDLKPLRADEDVPAEIRANVMEYMIQRMAAAKRRKPYPAFHARPALTRDELDIRGVLTAPGVKELVGTGIDIK